MAISINDLLRKFEGVQAKQGYWMARCPAHDDHKQSLSITPKDGGIRLKCHTGCDWRSILDASGSAPADVLPEAQSKNGHKEIVATYDYRDESGKLLYQAVRFEPKDFKQRRPDGGGGWTWNLEGVDRVLYRLPELIADDSDGWVFIPEGEKDVDETLRAWGLTATCNVGGAGKWRKEYSKYCKGRKVCILPDNDPPRPKDDPKKEGFPGQKHAVRIYDSIRETAEIAIILALPNLPIKGDVSDWKRAGGTRDQLLAMVDELAKLPPEKFAHRVSKYSRLITDPDFQGDPADVLREEPPADPKQIFIDYKLIRDLPTLTGLAWQALLQANKPPKYFKRGDLLVRVERDDGGICTRELTPNRMRYELAEHATWLERGSYGQPPKGVVDNVLAKPEPELPRLNRVVEVPVFAPNGTLQTEPGYHADARVYYCPAPNLKCLAVPPKPTAAEIRQSIDLIEELICDFPFASQSDKSHVIGLLLLPLCRDLIDGPTPNHLIEASMPRSGKSKLASAVLGISLGKNIFLMTAPRDNDEWEKKITTALLEDAGAILIDNVNHRLDSDKLAAALTADVHRGRILGRSASANIPIRCVWVTTANNLNVTEENAGRMVRTRLTPLTDSPERRTGFRHPDLNAWIRTQRPRLIQAAHILIQNWISEGKPQPSEAPLGSYEHWSHVIGGILQAAGIPGFLANFAEFYAASNKDKVVWREFCSAWWEQKRDLRVITADLLPLAASVEGFYLRGESEQARKISLGRQLEKKDGAVYSKYRIVRDGISGGYVYWKLDPVEAAA